MNSFPRIDRLIFLFAPLFGVGAFVCALASDYENANLNARVLPGPLEIAAESVAVDYRVGDLESGADEQIDAVHFLIEGLVINDLNGDGRGWRLTADPKPLSMGESFLEIGTIGGFVNFQELQGISSPSLNELLSVRGDGIAGFETDYEVSYNIPAFAPVGTYQGNVYFTIVAE